MALNGAWVVWIMSNLDHLLSGRPTFVAVVDLRGGRASEACKIAGSSLRI
jgi:hypothetical protein